MIKSLLSRRFLDTWIQHSGRNGNGSEDSHDAETQNRGQVYGVRDASWKKGKEEETEELRESSRALFLYTTPFFFIFIFHIKRLIL